MLHITNGDATVQILQESDVQGARLPWRDVLHEGPVPLRELSLRQLSAVRAGFIAGEGWAPADEVRRGFDERDAVLEQWREHGEVVLWFEHDLYDQLQLIQILDFFADQQPEAGRLHLLCIDRHPEIERFFGLGQLTPEQLGALFDDRRPVTWEQLELARSTWRAFRDPDPTAIMPWLGEASGALPFLAAALRRHLEQFPSMANGLGRTEQQILEGVASGLHQAVELFRADQRREESPFLGDSIFQNYIERLASGQRPLLDVGFSEDSATITLTENGERVLAGDADRVHLGGVDFWLGGVHLAGREVWRWSG